jgi:ribosomal protein S18 acetylase RimI-like enzyme
MASGNNDLQFVSAARDHVLQMMAWFPSRHALATWGGWEFRFPFTAESFLADCRLAELPSYALVHSTELYGFGQFYLRAGRCHLSRLVVAPDQRRRGLGTQLIQGLLRVGRRQLQVSEASLFLHSSNTPALALYERLGFRRAPYPEAGIDLQEIVYMIAP